MKVLRVHNHYREDGGESAAERAERELLARAGHEVVVYERHNDETLDERLFRKATLAPRTVWAWDTVRELRALLDRERPDVAHFTNTFPLISPAAYEACRAAGVPVVQSLHNYRLLCPAATFLRRGRVCEECVDHSLWRSVFHGCYRESRAATAVTAAMLALHRRWGTFAQRVEAYIALTEFARRKFADGGLPAERIFVKPNFTHPDPGPRTQPGEYALFAGRLSPEKGLDTLLRAWEELGDRVPLRIAGDGPMRGALEAQVARVGLASVRFLGRLPRKKLIEALRRASFLVVPSHWYEGLPLVIVEAFACGVPVIASDLGAMPEIVEPGRTGLHFEPRNPGDLAARIWWAWRHRKHVDEMGRAARAEYERYYSPERNLEMLLSIYAASRRNGSDVIARKTGLG
jgi:glycosyltransferase involved in cell wall biosynthesis